MLAQCGYPGKLAIRAAESIWQVNFFFFFFLLSSNMQDYHTEMPFGDKEDMSPLLLKDGPEVEEKREHSSTKRGPSGWAVIDSLQHSFNPSIEGLRGIAVSLTMICHILQEQYQFREVAGNMGVCIFFVLSGFLITAVLIRLQVSGAIINSLETCELHLISVSFSLV